MSITPRQYFEQAWKPEKDAEIFLQNLNTLIETEIAQTRQKTIKECAENLNRKYRKRHGSEVCNPIRTDGIRMARDTIYAMEKTGK